MNVRSRFRHARQAVLVLVAAALGLGWSLQSVNFPARYIRHFDFTVYLASDGGSNSWDSATLWPQDTSWLVAAPRA